MLPLGKISILNNSSLLSSLLRTKHARTARTHTTFITYRLDLQSTAERFRYCERRFVRCYLLFKRRGGGVDWKIQTRLCTLYNRLVGQQQRVVNHSDDIIDRNHVARMFREGPHSYFFFSNAHTQTAVNSNNKQKNFSFRNFLCRNKKTRRDRGRQTVGQNESTVKKIIYRTVT